MVQLKVTLSLILILLSQISCESTMRAAKIRSVQDSVVKIVFYSGSGVDQYKINVSGTGFFIKGNRIVTAFHVIENHLELLDSNSTHATFMAVKSLRDDSQRFSIPIVLEVWDKENDLAVFQYESDKISEQWGAFEIKPLEISPNLPEIGDEVTIAGFHDGYSQPTSSVGIVAQITPDERLLNDITILPGMSGSPLVSIKTGLVIGVNNRVNLVRDAFVRLNVSSKSQHLIELLEKPSN